MINNILLINPPTILPEDSVKRVIEPLGLLYVASMLRDYKVTILDMRLDYNLVDTIKEVNPYVVGITCPFSSCTDSVIYLCNTIKSMSDAIIVIGGIHATFFPEKFIEHCNYIVMGEGEYRFLHLLNCLNNHKFINHDGIMHHLKNPPTSRIGNLDLPYPDRDLVDMEKYFNVGLPAGPFSRKQRVAHIIATRGCFQKCVFCASAPYWGRQIKKRSIEHIIGEITLVKEKYGVEEIQFIDDNLTADKEFAKELFRQMKKLNLIWCTPNGLMADSVDNEMVRLMAESGAYQITLAVESASERVLEEIIHKQVNLDNIKPIIDEAHKYDIDVHGMFVVGFPGETKEEIYSTLSFPFRAGFDSVSFFIANPLPGSELYDICKAKGYIVNNHDSNLKAVNINIPEDSPDYNFSSTELEALVDYKTKEFNMWYKKNYPEKWDRKFERYLKHNDNKLITGRVV